MGSVRRFGARHRRRRAGATTVPTPVDALLKSCSTPSSSDSRVSEAPSGNPEPDTRGRSFSWKQTDRCGQLLPFALSRSNCKID